MRNRMYVSLRPLLLFLSICVAAFSAPTPSIAEQPASLRLVPADASFYTCTAHLREQFDALMASRAVAKLRQMPIVQMGLAMAQAEWNDRNGDYADFKALVEQPENKQLVELLIDAVSHEVFMYGDEGYADLLAMLQDFNRANQSFMRDLAASNGDVSEEKIATRLQQLSAKYLGDLRVPETVVGFKLSDADPAVDQLTRLEQLLNALLESNTDFKDRLSRQTIAGGEFLTLRLDGSLIPWEQVEVDAPIDISGVREKVSKMELTIAVGVLGDYLVVSIGENQDHLGSFGKGDVLADHKSLAPLRKHLQKNIVSVGYVSEGLMKNATSSQQQLDQLVTAAETLLPLSELDEVLQKEMLGDVEDLVKRFKKGLPNPGAGLNFAFTTDRGYEGFSYSWAEGKMLDATKPLTILEHVGGDPILVAAGRGQYSPDSYETLAKLAQRGFYYCETILIPQLDSDERDFFRRVRGDLVRLAKQLDQITRNKFLPAFRDGQVAVVLDAKVSSKQWHQALPETADPLPMLELGLVYGVSDADLVREGAVGYFKTIQEVIDTLHEAEPTTIPDFKLPAPEVREFPEGDVYYYLLPRELGLDKQVAPNAGLSKDTLVLSAIPKTTRRLLAKTTYQGDDIVSQHQDNAGGAFRFSLSSLIDAFAPWIDYGVEVSGEEVDEGQFEQVRTGLEIAKCFRTLSTVTYQEDGAWVTHYETHFEDLPE